VYCASCGTHLPDDANYCLKCGRPQREEVKGTAFRWETCTIDIAYTKRGFLTQKVKLWADATGPRGSYRVAESPDFEPYFGQPLWDEKAQHSKVQQPLNELISKLLSEGWEPLPNKGELWYNLRFRRRAN
jgi:hypothetical protein